MSISQLSCLGGKPEFHEIELLIKPFMPLMNEIEEKLKNVHNSVFITNGKYNREFEEYWAEKFHVKYALTVNNATIGLMIALKALVPEGQGEVILPPFTFAATGFSVLWNGLKPMFADIDKRTKNLSPKETEKKINSNTKVIMPVYIFSNPPSIKEFENLSERYKIPLLYDTAQGIGSKYNGTFSGSFGNIEVFSLAPTKVVTSVEGGMITTQDEGLYHVMKSLRDNGKTGEYDFTLQGLNARMTEYQAIVGLMGLKRLEEFTKSRRKAVNRYKEILSGLPGIQFQEEEPNSELTYNYMVVFIKQEEFGFSRCQLADLLKMENIQTKKYFYPLLSDMKPFQTSELNELPESVEAAEEGLALPLYNFISLDTVERTALLIKKIFKNKKKIIDFLEKNKK